MDQSTSAIISQHPSQSVQLKGPRAVASVAAPATGQSTKAGAFSGCSIRSVSAGKGRAESDEFRLKTVRFVSIIKKTIDAPQVSAQPDRLCIIFYI